MTVAFAYRARRASSPFQPVAVGTAITLDERSEYALQFPDGCSPATAARLAELGGSLISDRVGVLSFGNFVGRAELAGATLDVVSTKIGDGGVSALLAEISQLASNLIFGWRSPTGFQTGEADNHQAPVPYHQLQLLRRVMLQAKVGTRLQDWLAAIERSPTRRFEPERPVTASERVRRLDTRAVQSIFQRMERLVPVPAGAVIADNPLARALTFGCPPQTHFPVGIAAPRGRLSFDTPENRFTKHVLTECLALVYRFVDHSQLHQSLRDDCREMLSLLEQAIGAPFLADATRLTRFSGPSQALAKGDGYREVFGFWQQLSRHVSLPSSPTETIRLLEGRDMATLYEYWVFLKVLETVSLVSGGKPTGPVQRRRDELGESLIVGLSADVGPSITVSYNPTYRRTTGTAYSTPLRPDVIVTIAGRGYAFDAKYRLDWFDVGETDADDGLATYKRADLYKMHTYRDAITDLAAAFVVYPGTEFVFFERTGSKRVSPAEITLYDGVGAVPLRPTAAEPTSDLEIIFRSLLGNDIS